MLRRRRPGGNQICGNGGFDENEGGMPHLWPPDRKDSPASEACLPKFRWRGRMVRNSIDGKIKGQRVLLLLEAE